MWSSIDRCAIGMCLCVCVGELKTASFIVSVWREVVFIANRKLRTIFIYLCRIFSRGHSRPEIPEISKLS